MSMPEHTSKAFDVDLDEVKQKVSEMSTLVERQVLESIEALDHLDPALANHVIAGDAAVDALQYEIEEKAVRTIARRQPMAVDLRVLVGSMRIAGDLERIGDLAKNIGKRVSVLGNEKPQARLTHQVQRIGEAALLQLRDVIDAYSRRDVAKALQVWNADQSLDAMTNALLRELLTYMMEDARSITSCLHLIFCAKNIERIGDHATNIAEIVYYITEGQLLTEARPKADTTGFAPVT